MKIKNFYNFKNDQNIKPPFLVLIDTNFIYFTLKNKIDLFEGLLNCLCALYIPVVSRCVIMELEKLGVRFRLALKCIRDDRIIKLECNHPPNIVYADDCIYNTAKNFKCFIIATCDKDLKRRIRNLLKRPVISIKKKKFYIESENQIR
uniref:PIN domain-containing protein n=1 Tax=Cryptomonas curvata TaxID=233186 RepID=A0A7S0LV95_9CRYP|nr:pre-rRNA processing protein, FCF1 [Cryptomonas curvata]|mmetsp:Transcript_12046/g.25898  ORF Transcript_12046/g.25898 Transcript_12046/m.25898 type:complete len:148 (+) Transcript_12046:254-697(+)